MKKIVIIPDSFKGTISSQEAGRIIEEEAKKRWPDVETVRMEIADGGEGSVDAFLSVLDGEKKQVKVRGPYGEQVESFYGKIKETAVIEMAAAAGLPLAGERLTAGEATTYGVGELILDALQGGVKKIILGLGGSATNEGGAGALTALGVKFLNERGEEFIPVGNTLHCIKKIDLSELDQRIKETEILVMCDVSTVLCGANGATAIFGPQKGVEPEEVSRLDDGLRHFAEKIYEVTGKEILQLEGGGAAGGMGAGIAAILGGKLMSGIDIMLDTITFEEVLKDTSMVITGEGKIDGQSSYGKVISGVAKRAKKYQVPVIALAGAVTEDADLLYEMGVSAMFGINRRALSFEELKATTKMDLRKTAESIFRLMDLSSKV